MFNPRRWVIANKPAAPHYYVTDESGTAVATVDAIGDAELIRCAPDMFQFIADALSSGVLSESRGKNVGPRVAEARRLLERAEGLRA